MGNILSALRWHRIVGIDTPVFIYHIEQSQPWAEVAGSAFDALAAGQYAAITSVLTLMELTVKPLSVGRTEVADSYQMLVQDIPNLLVAGIDVQVTRRAAELRARYGIRTPDALQFACCLTHGASAFLTNDHRLRQVREIDVLLLDDFVER